MRPGGEPALVWEEVEEPMPDELIIRRHSQCQPSPISTLGEAPRAAASFNQALQRTCAPLFRSESWEISDADCALHPLARRTSLSLGRYATK